MAFSKFLDPKNDVAFKHIFGTEKNKGILIHFLNDILNYQGDDMIQDVEFLSPIQDPDIASKKQSIVDVLCKDKNGNQIIIEMQVAPSKGFEKRAQYYAAKAYSRQADKAGKYAELKKVIFIAIADTILFPHKTAYKSDHVILDQETHEHDLKDFSFTFIELPKFTKKLHDTLNNMIEKWCVFFKYADETRPEDLAKIIGSDLVIQQAYEALDQFSWPERELLAYEQERKRVWDNQAVLDKQLEDAEAAGLAKGKAEGKIESLEHVARSMYKNGLSLELIAEVTGMDVAAVQQLLKERS